MPVLPPRSTYPRLLLVRELLTLPLEEFLSAAGFWFVLVFVLLALESLAGEAKPATDDVDEDAGDAIAVALVWLLAVLLLRRLVLRRLWVDVAEAAEVRRVAWEALPGLLEPCLGTEVTNLRVVASFLLGPQSVLRVLCSTSGF